MAKSKETKLEEIGEIILTVVPLFRKRILSRNTCNNGASLVSPQYKVLEILTSSHSLPISQIGFKLCISKPQMTILVNRMIKQGNVKKIPDNTDRRITNIEITPKGKIFFKKFQEKLKQAFSIGLAHLNNQDRDKLYESLSIVRQILMKVNEVEKNE